MHPGEENVAVGKHPHVVVFVARAGGISPEHLAIVDEKHFVVILADVEHRVLRQTVAGQIGGRDPIRPSAGGRLGFARPHRRHIGGGEAVEHGHARRRQGLSGRVCAAGGQCGGHAKGEEKESREIFMA